MWRFLFNPPFFRGLYLQFYISYSILNIHNYKNIQYYKKKISSDIPFNAFIVKWVVFFIFHLIVSVKYIEIMIFVCVFHTIFICDSSSVISSSVTLHLWSLHLWPFHLCLCLSSMARYITLKTQKISELEKCHME